jgi:hypothetical protein
MKTDTLWRCVRCGWVQGVNGEVCACLDETGERAVEEYVPAASFGRDEAERRIEGWIAMPDNTDARWGEAWPLPVASGSQGRVR